MFHALYKVTFELNCLCGDSAVTCENGVDCAYKLKAVTVLTSCQQRNTITDNYIMDVESQVQANNDASIIVLLQHQHPTVSCASNELDDPE